MRKPLLLLLVGTAIGGGGWFFDHYKLEDLKQFKLRPRRGLSAAVDDGDGAEHADSARPLRIAALKVRAFSSEKLEVPKARAVLAEAARHFDILAITDIDPRGSEAVTSLVDSINAASRQGEPRHYDAIVGPAVGHAPERRAALVFDADRLDLDRGASYVVADPDHLLAHPPLVGWFRAHGLSAAEAFTFTVMAVDCQSAELDAIGAAYRAVRDDGRGEDDVILAGDFGAANAQLEALVAATHLTAAIVGIPTNTRGDRQTANLLYSPSASEFNGRAGVMDLVRQFNLTVEQSLAISEQMPVWAEFSRREAEGDGLASRFGQTPRFGQAPVGSSLEFVSPDGSVDAQQPEVAGRQPRRE